MLNGEVINENILHGEIQREIISLLKKEEEIIITPSLENKVYTPTENTVFSKVTAKGVTADIDENIKAENIKLGVNILGIEGNVAPDKPDQEKTVYPNEQEQVVEADLGYELSRAIVKPIETETKTIVPTIETQVIKPAEGKYIKEVTVEAIEDIEPEIAEQETLLAELEEDVNALKDKDDTTLRLLNGTLEEFDNHDYGLTELKGYAFSFFEPSNAELGKLIENKVLKKVDLTGITAIGNSAFRSCTGITDLIIDKNISTIGAYAFVNVNNENTTNFELETAEYSAIYYHAFEGSSIKRAKIHARLVGGYVFSNCKDLTDLEITLKTENENPSVLDGQRIFADCTNVKNFYWNSENNVSIIPSYTFYKLGVDRENPQDNVFVIDLRKSNTMKIVGNYSFHKAYWHDVFLPTSFNTFNQQSFSYSNGVNVFLTTIAPPTIYSDVFSNATNYKIFVPYDYINTYKTATNWVTRADYIYGWAEENTFEQGAVLPTTNAEGLTLTWYSDKGLTTQVTNVDNSSAIYYCVASEVA